MPSSYSKEAVAILHHQVASRQPDNARLIRVCQPGLSHVTENVRPVRPECAVVQAAFSVASGDLNTVVHSREGHSARPLSTGRWDDDRRMIVSDVSAGVDQ
jgi:hypothetical protein